MHDVRAFLMNISEYLTLIHRTGLNIWVDNGGLRYSGIKDVSTREHVSLLRERKDEIIGALGTAQSLDEILNGPLPRSWSRFAPLSVQQDSLWSVRDHFNVVIRVSLRIYGFLDHDAFRQSLDALATRHESLRTRIVVSDDAARQCTESLCRLEVNALDAPSREMPDVEAWAVRLTEEFVDDDLCLDRPSLFRCQLLRLSSRDHILAIAMHHIVSDGISISILLKELWELYVCFAHGETPRLPALPLRYADYAIWQKNTYSFWREKDRGFWAENCERTVPLNLPFDAGIETVEKFTAADVHFNFSSDLSFRLCKFAKAHKSVIAIVLLAASIATVSRWCKQTNVSVLSLVSGRERPILGGMIGCLSKPLRLRVDLSECKSFVDLLDLTASKFEEAWTHLECGIIPSEAPIMRNVEPPLMFQWLPSDPTMTVTRAQCQRGMADSDLVVEPFTVGRRPGYYGKAFGALGLNFSDSPQGIRVAGHFRADLFKKETVDRFLDTLREFCEQVVEDPSHRLTE